MDCVKVLQSRRKCKILKENASAARSKRWFKSALLELMKEKPYQEIHIREICQRADLTRPNLLSYFQTKEEVLSHTWMWWLMTLCFMCRIKAPAH